MRMMKIEKIMKWERINEKVVFVNCEKRRRES